jgi:predicted nucleic acid-binding protein
MEKLKIYLDTNIIYGFFKNLVKRIFTGKEFKIPRKIQVVQRNLMRIEPLTSFFTLIEVIEGLKKWAEKKKRTLTIEEIVSLIEFFKENFRVEILRSVWITERTIQYVLSGIEWKDAIQLEIARVNEYILVTDDVKLRKLGKGFYEKIMSFNELEAKLEKS